MLTEPPFPANVVTKYEWRNSFHILADETYVVHFCEELEAMHRIH